MAAFDSSRSQDKVAILKRVPVFASCTEEQLELVAEKTRLVEYKKDEFIYREGDPADAFCMVASGRLRLFAVIDGHEKTLTVLHNGDSFGEISLLIGETHSASVQAINDSLLLRLEKKDFEHVINRIPSLVLYLSRLLSKRLRNREPWAEFSEATIVAIYSAARGVGRTCFAVALATLLKRETQQEVVILDFSGGTEPQPWLYGPSGRGAVAGRTLLGGVSEELIDTALSTHPLGFSVLSAAELLTSAKGEQAIAPLLSFLTKRFHYILIDLPVELNAQVLKALTQSDLIYLLTDFESERLLRTTALLQQLQVSVGQIEQRVKVVLNMRQQPQETVNLAELAQQLRHPIAFTLPHAVPEAAGFGPEDLTALLRGSTSPYVAAVRHVARELGGLLVGLALGSGAALGLAHIGVLKVLERERIPVDIISGSSIGALVAGLWASGRSADELEQMALEFKNPWDIRKLFVLDLGIPLFSVMIGVAAGALVGWLAGFWTGLLFGFMVAVALGVVVGPLSGGPIQGARLMAKLEKDFAGSTFEQARLPLKIIAANPLTREEVVFDSGPIALAVRASVSIPGIFKPVMVKGKLCLDGGVVTPIPVNVLKRAGAHRVIAVNVFPTTPELMAYRQDLQRRRADREQVLASKRLLARLLYRLRQELIRSVSPLIFDIIMRSMQSMEHQIAEVACREADITLRPTVPGSHWLEFFNPEKFIRRGEEETLQYLPELKRITRVRRVDNF